jgi:hypothetical protein
MPVPVRRYLRSDRFTAVYCVVAVVWLTVLGFVLPEVVPGHDLQVISKLGGAGLVVGITVLLFSLQAGFAAEDRASARGVDVTAGAAAGGPTLGGLSGITESGQDDGKHYTERMAVRRSVASLGPSVVMAVDDAGDTGIGYRELAMLAPRLIKLGMSTTRGIETDAVKQALVTGMVSFAGSTGSELVAKGVETESELKALVELGIRLGQGRLFGMPAPVEAFAGIGARSRGVVTLRRPIAPSAADAGGESAA